MKSVIRLEDVKKTYLMGQVAVHALNGLTLDIKDGEFIALQGPSGSGKSTAMNMIGCLDIPTSGTIYLNGQDISKLHESDLARIRGKTIGFIFQQFNLIATLTAMQNVMLPMMFQDMPEEKRKERAGELLDSVGLSNRMGHKPSELSGGQQQRVAIARALANNPEVLLADEPTGNLDTKTGAHIMELLNKLHAEGHTIVLVTHDEHVASLAERIAFIRDGTIVKIKKNRKGES